MSYDVPIVGQDVSVIVNSSLFGVALEVTDIKSCEFNFDRETTSEGYIGQDTEKKDSFFNGISGKLTFHGMSSDVMSLLHRINNATKRRDATETFDIAGVFAFPVGTTHQLSIPDVHFGQIPVNVGGRKDKVEFSIDFVAADYRLIPG